MYVVKTTKENILKQIVALQTDIPLFQGITFDAFERMLHCLSAKTVCYKKDEAILLSGDAIHSVGLILSGRIRVVKEDIEGNSTILTVLGASELFGELFACAELTQSPVTIQAAEDAEILFIDYRKIITSCAAACPFHTKLIANILKLLARKNLMLNQKIDILSKRTTREKLMCYFDTQRGTAKRFTIPLNRDELARYLCVDRSAMSSELGKMRKEGLIRFDRNAFELL